MYYVENIIKTHLVVKDGNICKLSLVKEETYSSPDNDKEKPIVNYWAVVLPREIPFPCWEILKSKIVDLKTEEDFNEDIMETQGWVSIDRI